MRGLGRLEVDLVDLQQREVALAFLGRPDLTHHRVARAQVEAADLRRRDVDVVGAGEVVLVGRAQEPEAVGQRLEHALGVDPPALGGLRLQDREDQVLHAHARGVLDAQLVGERGELGERLLLELLHVELRGRVVARVELELGVVVGLRRDRACCSRGSSAPPLPPLARTRRCTRRARGSDGVGVSVGPVLKGGSR